MAPISKFTTPAAAGQNAAAPDRDTFMKAVLAHDDKRIRTYLAQGADPNLPDEKNRLPLHAALRIKNDKNLQLALEALLAGGADPNLIDASGETGKTAFIAALSAGRNDKVLATLLQSGADPILEEDIGLPTLHYLALQGRYAVLEAAYAARVDLDHRDSLGRTPLMSAAREGFAKTVEVLLECGADPGVRDGQGFSVLQHAHMAPADAGGTDIVRMLTRALSDTGIRHELKRLKAEAAALNETVEHILHDEPSEAKD